MDDVDALERLSGGASYDMMTRLFSQYRGTIQLSRTTIQFLYRKYGILKKLVNIPANQMTFRWGNLQLGGKDGDAQIREAFERHTRSLPVKSVYAHRRGLATAFNLAQKAANKGGNGAILLDLEDGGALDEPINYNKLKRINGLFVLNRWAIKPLRIGATTDHDFYRLGGIAANRMLPSLVGVRALQSVHRSRVLWFRGEELDDDELMQTGGCDDSVFESILSSFFDYQDSICGAKQMIKDFDIFVHKLEGLLEELAEDGDGEYEAMMEKRLETNDTMRRIHRTQLIDKDKEDLVHSTRQVSGYSDLMTRILDNFLANTELTPAELLGKYPEGMADTGKTEQQNANDRTSRYQAEKFQSNIMDFCEILFRCKEGPTKGKVPDVYDFVFNLLYPVTPPEQAELQLNYAQIDDINIRNQVYSGDDVAKSRYGGNEFQPNMIIDFKQREKDKKAAQAQQSQEEQPPEDDIDALLKDYQTDAADVARLMPPPEVQAAARQGVTLYKQNNLKTDLYLTPLATRISMGQPLQAHEIQAMRTFFISPKYRKVAKQPPSEGFGAVIWLMMGGDVGDLWSGAIARELERRSDAIKAEHVAVGVGAVAAGAYLLNKHLETGKQAGQKCGESYISQNYECRISPSSSVEIAERFRRNFKKINGIDFKKGKNIPSSYPDRIDSLKANGLSDDEALSVLHYLSSNYEQINQVLYLPKDEYKKSNKASDEEYADMLEMATFTASSMEKLPKFSYEAIQKHERKILEDNPYGLYGEHDIIKNGAPLLRKIAFTTPEQLENYAQQMTNKKRFVHQSFMSTSSKSGGFSGSTKDKNEMYIAVRPKSNSSGRLMDVAMGVSAKDPRYIGEVIYLPGAEFKINKVEKKTREIDGYEEFIFSLNEQNFSRQKISIDKTTPEGKAEVDRVVRYANAYTKNHSKIKKYTQKKPAPPDVLTQIGDDFGQRFESIMEAKRFLTTESAEARKIISSIDENPTKYFVKRGRTVQHFIEVQEL